MNRRLPGVLAAAVLMAGMPLLLLTSDPSFGLVAAALIGLGEGCVRILLRFGIDGPAAAAGAVVPAVLLILAVLWWQPSLVVGTQRFLATGEAPLPAHPGVALFFGLGCWLLHFSLTMIAAGGAPAVFLYPPLVLPLGIATGILGDSLSPAWALPAGAALVVILAGRHHSDLAAKTMQPRPGAMVSGTLVLALLTTAGFLSVTEVAPALQGPGPDRGNGPVQLNDPSLDLQRNLASMTARPILSYRTADGEGTYLRMTALTKLDWRGFSLTSTELVTGNPDPPPGVDSGSDQRQVRVAIEDFSSEWLPLPWAPADFQAEGQWRHDPTTASVVSVAEDRTRATRLLEYTATSWRTAPTQERLAAAQAGRPVDQVSLELPEGLDDRLWDLLTEITSASKTDGEAATAIQEWLRSDAFTYQVTSIPGSGIGTINNFLLEQRIGYCEQFAGSMAILARMRGIPSRVAVGFAPGTRDGDVWRVTSQQMHAWPELYFEGLGWVAFEPTPGGGGAPETSPTSTASPSPATATASPRASQGGELNPITDDETADFLALLGWWPWLAVGTGLLLAGFGPSALRRWQRSRRLRQDRIGRLIAEDGWRELRASVIDSGLPWPTGTPRQVVAELQGQLPAAALEAALSYADGLDRLRYSPDPDQGPDPRDLSVTLSQLPAPRGLGRWWPRSLLRPEAN